MSLAAVPNFLERVTKLCVNLLGAITNDLESAASLRPGGSERGHDDMPAWLYRMTSGSNVAAASGNIEEEMEHRSIVPEVITVLGEVH